MQYKMDLNQNEIYYYVTGHRDIISITRINKILSMKKYAWNLCRISNILQNIVSLCKIAISILSVHKKYLLRKTVLHDWRDFLEARVHNLFILGSCVSVSKAVYFVIFL